MKESIFESVFLEIKRARNQYIDSVKNRDDGFAIEPDVNLIIQVLQDLSLIIKDREEQPKEISYNFKSGDLYILYDDGIVIHIDSNDGDWSVYKSQKRNEKLNDEYYEKNFKNE